MKTLFIRIIASVIVWVIGYSFVHAIFLLFGKAESQSWPLLILEAACTGATFGVFEYFYEKYKKK